MKKIVITIILFVLFSIQNIFSKEINLNDVPITIFDQEKYLNYAKRNKDTEKGFIALERAIGFNIQNNQYTKANQILNSFKIYFPKKIDFINKIQNIINEPKENISIENLGEQINSEFDEYMPIPTFDGQRLYYSTNRYKKTDGEEILFSDFNTNINNWSKHFSMESPVKTKKNESMTSISTDQNTIVLFGNYKGGIGRGDIFYSEKSFLGWQKIIPFPRPINSEYFESDAQILANNREMIFVSDRPNNLTKYLPKDSCYLGSCWGNTDIYVSQKINGLWYEPINLGKTINTDKAERFPFLHPDMKSLYFCSEGHPGLGKLDIFVSYRLNDTSWTEWTEPENVGRFINTPEDETNFVFSSDPDIAYVSRTDIKGFGGLDLYKVFINSKLKPQELFEYSATVIDNYGFKLEADLKWEEIDNNQNIGFSKTNPQLGTFNIFLPLNKKYKLSITKNEYFPFEMIIETKNGFVYQDTLILLKMNYDSISNANKDSKFYRALRSSEKTYFLLDEISFKSGSFYFDGMELQSIPELDEFANFLKIEKDVKIRLAGHADIVGSYEDNLILSIDRAKIVSEYLIRKGISPERFFITGFSNTRPIANNNNEEGRRKNRRVEYSLLK